MRGAQLSQGDVRLDSRTGEAWRAETSLGLTAREFRLLEALLVADGSAVSKQELLGRVWGTDFPGSPNIVEVYVRYLRRKLDEPPASSWMTSKSGCGPTAASS